MPSPFIKALRATSFALFFLSACRSTTQDAAQRNTLLPSDPCVAAKNFFQSHYGFYHEDPTGFEAALTPRLFQALKMQYDAFEKTRQIGALDCDPWTNAQDGEILPPYRFTTLSAPGSEAAVRFQYSFALGPKRRIPKSVVLKFQRSSSGAVWQVSDLIMPNNSSLVSLLESNP
jgi:hypothetical protein